MNYIYNVVQTSGGAELKIVASVTSGALVTATKGPLSVQATSVNGTATLTVPEAGTWSVSATLNGQTTTTETVDVVDTYSASLIFIDPVLNNNSWDAIKLASDLGIASNYWSVGDRKKIVINGNMGYQSFSNYETYAYIIGFNHNASVEGGNKIHFQLGITALSGGTNIALCDSKYSSTGGNNDFVMFASSSNSSRGWTISNIRTTLGQNKTNPASTSLMAALPADLRAVLKSVDKYTVNSGTTASTTTDYLFLLSEKEVFGTISNTFADEGNYQEQYVYYSAGNSKVKYRHTTPSNTAIQWLRSRNTSNSYSYVTIIGNGNVGFATSNYSNGIAPGFCV